MFFTHGNNILIKREENWTLKKNEKKREIEEYRRIREAQDQEYLKSAQIDAEKTRKILEQQEKELEEKEKEITEKILVDSLRLEKERQMTLRSTALLQTLPEEPTSTDSEITSLKILLPNGDSVRRRFYKTSPIQQLKDFVEVLRLPEMGGHLIPEHFDILTDYPRTYHNDLSLSFQTAGLINVVIKIEEIPWWTKDDDNNWFWYRRMN